ncbi:hypothetical protein AB0B44_44210, partial [Streptomyces sp. NPDC041003]
MNYGDHRDLVLLAAFGLDGTEVPLAEAAPHWEGIGSVVKVWPAMPLDELMALTESNTLPGGAAATGTDAEGFVLRFASGVRAKAKLSEYVRLHGVLTGVNERDIWRGHGIQRFAGLPAGRLAQGLNCTVADVEASGGKPLDALLQQVPDEFDAWVREVIARLEVRAAAHERAIDEAYAGLVHLAADRGAFARAVKELPDRGVRPAMFMRLDGRSTELTTWRHVRPEVADSYTTDEEGREEPEGTGRPSPGAAPRAAVPAAARPAAPVPAVRQPAARDDVA